MLDPTANTLGVVTSNSTMWTIGTAIGGPGALVGATGAGSSTVATGTLTNGLVTTIRLN